MTNLLGTVSGFLGGGAPNLLGQAASIYTGLEARKDAKKAADAEAKRQHALELARIQAASGDGTTPAWLSPPVFIGAAVVALIGVAFLVVRK